MKVCIFGGGAIGGLIAARLSQVPGVAMVRGVTRPTGEAHWEVLLRARAIETGSFVLAPAQGGFHEDGRGTWGHTLAVGTWGEILGQLDHDEPGVLVVDLDLAAVAKARAAIPALANARPFAAPEAIRAPA